jgi:hypothetical protein
VSWQILFASTFTTAGRTGALLTGLLLQDRPLPAKLLVLAPTRIMVAEAIELTCKQHVCGSKLSDCELTQLLWQHCDCCCCCFLSCCCRQHSRTSLMRFRVSSF